MSGTRFSCPPTTRVVRIGLTGAVLAVAALAGTGAAVGAAAPPANDLISSATTVTSVPSVFTQDTTQATRSPDDGESVHGHSVWFAYRPTDTRRLRVTTIGSEYDTVLSLFEGPRNNRVLVKSNDDRVDLNAAVQFRAVAGTRYWVAASALGRGPGGHLRVAFHKPGPLSVTTNLVSAQSGGTSGRLMIDGRIESVNPAAAYLVLEVSQRVGANVARGYTEGAVMSLGWGSSDWSLRLDSDTGWAFQPDEAVVTWTAYPTDGFQSEPGQTTTTTVMVTDDPAGRRSR
jgi:hypothetical protein